MSTLQERFKKKCEKLKKANERIKELQGRASFQDSYKHIQWLENQALNIMCGHLELKKYTVRFIDANDNKEYTEDNVYSFNKRLIKTALCRAICKRNGLIMYTYDVKIISVEEVD